MWCIQAYFYIFTVTLGNQMLSLLFLQESLQLFSTVVETSLATSLCRHGVISSNQLHSVRQASNQCVWSVIFRKNPCISSNFSARILKQKSWTWSHKRPSSFIYIFTFLRFSLRLTLDVSIRRHVGLSRDQQSCGAKEDWRWVSLTQSEKAKLFSLPNNIFANLWRKRSHRFARV